MEASVAQRLKECGVENPHLESRWMIEKSAGHKNQLEQYIEKRCLGVPLAYVLEERGFYKELFYVKPGVLIPRPETEQLVENGLAYIKTKESDRQITVFDFGCGSGCVGLSIIKEHLRSKLFGFDLSECAIEVSIENAKRLKVSDRASFYQQSVSDLHLFVAEKADVIVANPPYIAYGDKGVAPDVLKFEPHEALFSGATGFESIASWSFVAFQLLKSGGLFLMEFGKGQEKAVEKNLLDLGFSSVSLYKDLSGITRSVRAVKL